MTYRMYFFCPSPGGQPPPLPGIKLVGSVKVDGGTQEYWETSGDTDADSVSMRLILLSSSLGQYRRLLSIEEYA